MRLRTVWSFAVAGVLIGSGLAGQAAAAPTAGVEIPPAVQAEAADGPAQVLVTYDSTEATQGLSAVEDGTVSERVAAGEQASKQMLRLKKAALARAKGVKVKHEYDHLPVQVVTVENSAALAELASAPGVVALAQPQSYRLEPTLQPAAEMSTQATTSSWQQLINQPAAVSRGYDGRGARVAVLDAGISATASNASTFGDCTAGFGTRDCRIDSFTDAGGSGVRQVDPHGTNVAGLVALTAPAAHLDIYNVFRREAGTVVAYETDILRAMNQVASQAAARDIRAINLSLGASAGSWHTSPCDSTYSQVFNQLRANGVVPVVAAGNAAYPTGSYRDGLSDPACASGAVSVGAVYATSGGTAGYNGQSICTDSGIATDRVACFSQGASYLDLLAPGVNMSAAGVTMTGTSQATPVVSGAVAAIASAARTASPDQLVNALKNTGKAVGDSRVGGRTTKRVDVAAAGAALVPGPNQVVTVGSRLTAGKSITEQQRLLSLNGQHDLRVGVVGFDESLRIGGPSCPPVRIATPSGERTNVVIMQGDGNLVLYSNGVATWSSRTHGNPGASATIQDDGNLVVYSSAGRALWASRTLCSSMTSFDPYGRSRQSQVLSSGQYLLSPDRRYKFIMQGDGNAVLYGPRGATWSSGTARNPGSRLVMQDDGNLVVYTGNTAKFASRTQGSGVDVSLRLQSDGNLVIYRSGAAVWSTGTAGR